jgi:erythromycin esterase-like protein
MSNLKKKLSDEVSKLAYYMTDDMGDMTRDMETIYFWALNNAPIHKLREWKKEFKKNKKLREQEDSNDG